MLLMPQHLVELSSGLSASSAFVPATDVYSIGAGTRRKRSEVVVAVERSGIQLYDVRSSETPHSARRKIWLRLYRSVC